jgi:hypothetical protein
MRSLFFVGGLACLAGVLFVKGYLLRSAGAAGNGGAGTEIRFEYTNYDDERPPALPAREERPREPDPGQSQEGAAAPPPSTGDAAASEQPAGDPEVVAADAAPHADAGPDRVTWMGDQQLSLDGSASRGEELSYSWRQLSGPVDLQIQNPRAAQTVASGLVQEWPEKDPTYEFELAVRDVQGQEGVDIVYFTVKAAPDVSIIPAPKRRLAWRDGYLLAHFEAWKTNRTDETEAFAIRSPSELTFQQLSGTAEFELVPTEASSGFEYQLTVFYRDAESSTFLEFFVDTPERIPAILQFGVEWE